MNQAATHATGATVPQTPVSQNWPARSLTYRDPRLLALIFVTLVSTVQGIDPSLHGVAMPNVTTEFGLETNIAAELQAGFGARNVEEARAECIADAYIFQGLWLSSDDSVSSLCARYCCKSCSGADEKALDVHL